MNLVGFSFHPVIVAAASIAASLSVTVAVSAQFTLSGPVQHAVGSRPSGVAAGDFNGDGFIDLATTVDLPDRIVTLLNDAGQGFIAGPVIALPNSSSPQDVLAGDLDGNGTIDLAVILRDFNLVATVLNSGGAVFAMGASTAIGASAQGMHMADMDGDKDVDLVVANRDSNTATVLRNNGDATFAPGSLNAGAEPRGAAFGRFTDSPLLGVAVSNHDDRSVSVFTQSTPGVFALAATLFVGVQDRPDGIVAADLNGDGLDDIATTSGDDTDALNRVVLFTATSASAFTGPLYRPAGPGAIDSSEIAAVDLDCDSMPDLVASNQTSNNMSMLRNLGAGNFAAAQLVSAGTRPGRLVAADFDNDGDHDLAVANRDSNNLAVYTNGTCMPTPPACNADTNGDNLVNVNDLLTVINGWGTCPKPPAACAGDVAPAGGDGATNVNDLLAVINAWGPCP